MAEVGPWIVAAFVGLIVAVTVRHLGTTGPLRTWRTPEGSSDWGAPVLGVLGFATIGVVDGPGAGDTPGFLFGAIFGAVCGALTPGPLKTLRDYALSAVGVYATWLILRGYLEGGGRPSSAAVAFVPVAALVILGLAFAVGVLINVVRTFALPQLGIAMFGALEVLVFIASPFGVDLISEAPVSVNVVMAVVAGVVGFAVAAAPNIIVRLAAIAISAAEVGVNVVLWVDAGRAGRAAFLDWSGVLAIAGCVLGFGLLLAVAEFLRDPGAHLRLG